MLSIQQNIVYKIVVSAVYDALQTLSLSVEEVTRYIYYNVCICPSHLAGRMQFMSSKVDAVGCYRCTAAQPWTGVDPCDTEAKPNVHPSII